MKISKREARFEFVPIEVVITLESQEEVEVFRHWAGNSRPADFFAKDPSQRSLLSRMVQKIWDEARTWG